MQHRPPLKEFASLGQPPDDNYRELALLSSPKVSNSSQPVIAQSSEASPIVLVADDNDDTRHMLRTLLEMKGYRVIEASDGEQTVETAQLENPGLVFLDLELPRLDGLGVIRRLRSELQLLDLPLVVISGHDQHFEAALAAGCDDYLVKPIDFEQLEAVLECYVPHATKAQSA